MKIYRVHACMNGASMAEGKLLRDLEMPQVCGKCSDVHVISYIKEQDQSYIQKSTTCQATCELSIPSLQIEVT